MFTSPNKICLAEPKKVCIQYNTLLQIDDPILDAEGYTVCPDCDAHINCGTIGLANLEKHHHGMKICKATQQKRDKEARTSKNGNILSFLVTVKPKAKIVPSTIISPALVHGYKLITDTVFSITCNA